jgi:hypothetical protein
LYLSFVASQAALDPQESKKLTLSLVAKIFGHPERSAVCWQLQPPLELCVAPENGGCTQGLGSYGLKI